MPIAFSAWTGTLIGITPECFPQSKVVLDIRTLQTASCARKPTYESRVDAALFGAASPAERKPQRILPDFRSLQEQLQRHPYLTTRWSCCRAKCGVGRERRERSWTASQP